MGLDASEIVVYLGPTLPVTDARTVLDADYRAPVKRGDINSLLAAPPIVVGLVDGVFFQDLAVSPKEILRALDMGVRVFGASSMGALRAAELGAFGMIGIGRVFQLFKSGQIDADDEVAVAYTEPAGRPLSEPMVNIRCALERAFNEGIVTAQERRQLVSRMKRVYFPLRTYSLLFELSRDILPQTSLTRLQRFLIEHKSDVKRDDAILMLHEIRNLAG